jgi:hypothetical protein
MGFGARFDGRHDAGLTDKGKRDAPENSGSEKNDEHLSDSVDGCHNRTHEKGQNEPQVTRIVPVTLLSHMIGSQTNPSIDGQKDTHLKGGKPQKRIIAGKNGVEEGITQGD